MKIIWEFILNLNLIKIGFVIVFLFCILFPINSYAEDDVFLSLSSGGAKAGIGLMEFVPQSGIFEEINLSKDLENALESDLILSRHFNVVTADTSYKFDIEEQFSYWTSKNVSALITGNILIEKTDKKPEKLTVKVKVYDVETRQIIWEDKYSDKVNNYRYIAHKINDEIVKRFTGEEGFACSKIAFINDSTKFKEVYVVDYDGYNLRRYTKDNKLNILPKWVPNSSRIIYTSYLYNNSDLFVLDILKNKRKALSTIQGLNSPACFSPDKKTIIATLSRGVYPNLYLLDEDGTVIRRLTEGRHIDTSPSFSPSGKEVVFISDRAGYPQIYIMDIDGVNLRRLSTKENCDSPTWSPKGDKIAFTMRYNGKFDICLYDLPKQRIIKLTENSGDNENPSWSQDGRFIVFSSTRTGKSEIYIMGIDGTGIRKLIDMPGNSYTPAWSQSL